MKWKLLMVLGILALFPVLLLGLKIEPQTATKAEGAADSPQPTALPASPDYQYLIFKTKIIEGPALLLVQQSQPAPEQVPPAGPVQPVPGPGGVGEAWGWNWWWWVIIIILIIFFIIIFSGWGGRGGRAGGPPPPDERI